MLCGNKVFVILQLLVREMDQSIEKPNTNSHYKVPLIPIAATTKVNTR